VSADNNPLEEWVDDLLFYRTNPERGILAGLPVANQLAVIQALRKRLQQLIPRVKPNILHAHSPALNGVATVTMGKKFSIPTVYEVRGFWEDAAVSHGTSRENSLRYKLTRDMETWVLKQADAVTCICEGIKNDLIGRGIPAERITIVPNAVDPDRFQAISQRDPELESALGLKKRPVIGFVGSFYAYEGLKLLLDAMPAILEGNPEVRLLLVGGGQEADSLKEKATQMGIGEQLLFTGRVPNDQVARYYSLIDILCYPRLPMRLTETVTPLKPLEAMAQQKLIIASDVGGHLELIQDGKTGILFKAGDSADLARKVLYMFDNRKDWQKLLVSGRSFIEQERTWTRSVAHYAPVYEKLC
jgi:PEP-CTERM/exosortase A-associated glycosyltransferase